MVYVLLANGFEEVEALAPVDLLRRAGVPVQTLSVEETATVIGARQISVLADGMLADLDFEEMEMLVLPGGYPGYENLGKCKEVCALLVKAFQEGKEVAAICGAPVVPGRLGLLKGYKATCYPGMESELDCAEFIPEKVVTDRNLTTSRGAGTALDFALALVAKIVSAEKAEELRKGIVYA